MRLCRQGLRLAFALLALFPVTLAAQSAAQGYVYTNDNQGGTTSNVVSTVNTVTAFAVASDGTLSQIFGSPFSTGGLGSTTGEGVESGTIVVGNFLFVANAGSNNVSSFTIDPFTGFLTLVDGSPFATLGIGNGADMALAATPDGKYLYAGSLDIVALIIGPGGVLKFTSSEGLGGIAVRAMKVSPDGKYLIATLSTNEIAVFSIASDGSLSPVTGSPFASTGSGADGVDINCAGSQLFVGNAVPAPQVDVFNFPPSNGSMIEITGSPFSGGSSAQGAAVVALSPDDSELFVSNQISNSVTVFTVASGGALTLVPSSPFTSGVGLIPAGLAANRAGTLLYSANFGDSTVSSLAIGTGGSLASVSSSPFPDPNALDSLVSLAAYPPKQCPSFTTPQLPIVPGTPMTFTYENNIISQTILIPAGSSLGGAAYMAADFQQSTPSVFDASRLPSTSTNLWSGGTPVAPGATCTPIAGAGGNCIVTEDLCFDSSHNPIVPCNITAASGTQIDFRVNYQPQSAQTNPALIIATDGLNDWANITTAFVPATGAGTTFVPPFLLAAGKSVNTDLAVVNLPSYDLCLLYDPDTAAKSGSTIPLKMYLCDEAGTDLSGANVVVHATGLNLVSTTTAGTVEDAGNANPDSDFRFDATLGPTGGYIFNLQTKGLASGTYHLHFTAGTDTADDYLVFQVK
jgi:WD40 repeat protein